MTRGVTFQYLRHAVALGGVHLKPFPVSVSHGDLARATLPESGPASELMERYVRHAVFRKDLVGAFPVWKGLCFLLLDCALIPWYAVAAAASEGRRTPAAEDFSEAVRCVEWIYGCHSKLPGLLEAEPRLDDIVASAVQPCPQQGGHDLVHVEVAGLDRGADAVLPGQQHLVAKTAAAVQEQAIKHRVGLLGIHTERVKAHGDG